MKKLSVLFKLALRNMRRYKKRYFIVGLIICFSSFSMVTFFAFQQESYKSISDAIIDILLGHIIIMSSANKPSQYLAEERDWEEFLPLKGRDKTEIEAILNTRPEISVVTTRTRFGALLLKEEERVLSCVVGIEPEQEYRITRKIQVVSGERLKGTDQDGILLTPGIARKIGARIGDRLILLTTTPDGYTANRAFRLCGIVSLQGLDKYELDFVYVHNQAAHQLLNITEDSSFEYILKIKDKREIGRVKELLQKEFNSKGIRASAYLWSDLGGIPVAIIRLMKYIFVITLVIAFLIITLFIVNTTLTLILNRKKEIGTLRAIGIHKKDIVVTLLLETGLVDIVSSLIGIVLGCLTVVITEKFGSPRITEIIEFVFAGQSMHPKIIWFNPVITFVSFFIMTLLASLIPAYYAGNLQPIEAIER